jgi:hypothetical protein
MGEKRVLAVMARPVVVFHLAEIPSGKADKPGDITREISAASEICLSVLAMVGVG